MRNCSTPLCIQSRSFFQMQVYFVLHIIFSRCKSTQFYSESPLGASLHESYTRFEVHGISTHTWCKGYMTYLPDTAPSNRRNPTHSICTRCGDSRSTDILSGTRACTDRRKALDCDSGTQLAPHLGGCCRTSSFPAGISSRMILRDRI